MNKLIACALLGFGLTSFVVACGDDDGDNDPGTAGTNAGGSGAAGKNSGGSTQGGSGGKSTGGGGVGGTSTGGGGAGGSSAGGTASGGENVGGDFGLGGVGGDVGEGGGPVGEGGAGGAPAEVEETADPYWLSRFCDSQSKETLDCTASDSWSTCFKNYIPFLPIDSTNGVCSNEEDFDNFPLTLAMVDSLGALAAACPDPKLADWSCDLAGNPQPNAAKCLAARSSTAEEYVKCGGAPQ